MNRYNRSIFGLMEMCNKGYWTPADYAQKKIDAAEEEIAILDETCSRLRLMSVEQAETINEQEALRVQLHKENIDLKADLFKSNKKLAGVNGRLNLFVVLLALNLFLEITSFIIKHH